MALPNVQIERLPAARISATVRVEESEYVASEEVALKTLGERVNIQGFRPGKAPPQMVREKIGEDQLFETAVRHLLQHYLPLIVTDEKLRPIIPPKVEIASRLPLTVRITFVERPQITVKNADKITIEKHAITIDPKDIERVVDSVRQEHRTTAAVERSAAKGDQVTIDFSAKNEKDEPLDGLTAENYAVTLGSSSLLPGFEDALLGLSKNESKTFSLTLPEKFPVAELQNKPATFSVTVKSVEEVSLPEFTDAFVKEKLNRSSVAEFKTFIEESMKAQEEEFDAMRRERTLLDEIKSRTQVEIAPELLDEELHDVINDWQRHVESRGLTIEDAIKREGKTVEQMEEGFRKQAEERIKLRFGIAKLIEDRKVEATEEELESRFQDFQKTLPEAERAGAQKEWTDRGSLYGEIRWRLLTEKLLHALLQ